MNECGEKKNIFVIALDDFNRKKLETIPCAERYNFHELLDFDAVIRAESYDFDALVEDALRQLRAFPGRVDGIITHWDFPASTIQPVLCKEMGLPHAPLEAVLACEHKYWSRVAQQKVLPDMVPAFDKVDPFDDHALENLSLDFPFWIKPVKSFASHLGFRVNNEEEFKRSIGVIRQNIRRIGEQFDRVLSRAMIPPELEGVNGCFCVAEKLISGWQCGVEGYVIHGEPHVHGVFDCYKDRNNWSFNRYEYPSRWPTHILDRLVGASQELITHLRYDNAPFCVEFFWNPDEEKLWIIEVNTRISESHSYQFAEVNGFSNHEIAVKVALGEMPTVPRSEGKFKCSAKFHLRRYHDTRVLRVPDEKNIRKVEETVPGAIVRVTARAGETLSKILDQDSHSYEVATLHLGAENQAQLLQRFRQCAEMLDFDFEDGGKPEAVQFTEPVHW